MANEFSLEPSFQDIEQPYQLYQRKAAEAALADAVKYNKPEENWLERRISTISKGFETNLTTSTLNWAREQWAQQIDPSLLPDPNYTVDRYEADLKRALDEEGISPNFLSTLEGAHSPGHMQYLITRAKQRQEVFQQLQEAGTEGTVTTLLGNILDPVGLVAGTLTGSAAGLAVMNAGRVGLSANAIKAASAARTIGAFTAAGAVGNVSIEALRDIQGVDPVEAQDYLYSAGIGGLLGLGIGIASARLPIFSKINADIRTSYEKLVEKGRGKIVRFSKEEKEAIHAEPSKYPEARPTTKSGEPIPPGTVVGEPLYTPQEQTPEAIFDIEPPAPTPPIAEVTVPNPLAPDQNIKISAALDQPPPPVEAAKVTDQAVKVAEVERKLTAIEDTAKDLQNPRYVGAYRGPDGSEYKLMVAPGEGSSHVGGPYLVFKKAPGETKFVKFSKQPVESKADLEAQIFAEGKVTEVDLTPVVEQTETGYKASIKDGGKDVGYVEADLKDGVLEIRDAFLAERLRGQGTGLAMYKALIDQAHDLGLQIRSSNNLSDAAKKLYARLGKSGYNVTELGEQFQVFQHNQLAMKQALDDLPANYADIEDWFASKGQKTPKLDDAQVMRASFFMELGADPETAVKLAKGGKSLGVEPPLPAKAPKETPKEAPKFSSADEAEKYFDEIIQRIGKEITPQAARALRKNPAKAEELLAEAQQALKDAKKVSAMGGEPLRKTQIIETDPAKGRQITGTLEAQVYELQDIVDNAKPANGGTYGVQGSLSAAMTPTAPEFLKDPSFKALGHVDVPRTGVSGWFGFMNLTRFDRAGLAGSRKASPYSRLIGPALMNETVGMSNHSAVPQARIIAAYQQFKQWVNPYGQILRPAIKEYMDLKGFRPLDSGRAWDEFNHEVFLYVTNARPGTQYSQPVIRAGNEMKRLHAEILKKAKDPGVTPGSARPVQGSENVDEDPFYIWRKWDNVKIRSAVDRFGQEPVINLLAKGFRAKTPALTVEESERLANYFFRAIHRRASGVEDVWSWEVGRGNYIAFKQLLKNETSFTEDEINTLLDKLTINKPEPAPTNMRRRALIDNSVEITTADKNGFSDTLRLTDLLNTDASYLFATYARRMAGWVSMANMKIHNPKTGDLVIDGITSTPEWNQVLQRIREWHAERGSLDTKVVDGVPTDHQIHTVGVSDLGELENLQFAFDRVLGRPDVAQMHDYAHRMRLMRKFMSARLMGQVGIAQAGETSFPVAHLGLQFAMKQAPALKRIINSDGRSVLTKELAKEIEAMGIGGERLHGFFWNTIDEVGDLPFNVNHTNSRTARRLEQGLDIAERGIYELSGMSWLQQQQQRWVASMFINWFANTSKKFSRGDVRRLAQLGIGEDMMKRIQGQVELHSIRDTGMMSGQKITRLNLLEWDDLEARFALEHATFRAANKFIQTTDPTSAAWWMSKPLMQTLLQFRSFPQTAYANQFLYGIHMGDPKAVMAFIMSTAWAAAMRALQVNINSVGRSDAQRFREKYASPLELAKAGFERSGWSSIIPGIADQLAIWTGGESIFNARTSGDPTGFISGTPVLSAARDLQQGVAGLARTVQGGPVIAQTEARALARLAPWSNLIGITNAINAMVSPLPERAPYKYGR